MTTNPYSKHNLLVFLLSVCIFGSSNASCQNNQIIQEQLDSLRQGQKEQSEKQKNSDDTLIFIKEQLADIQKRLNQVVTADALDKLQKEVDALNIKCNGLSTSKADKTDLDALQKKIDDMKIIIGELPKNIEDLETKFENKIDSLTDQVTKLKTEIDTTKDAQIKITTEIQQLSNDLNTEVQNLEKKINEAINKIPTSSDNIKALKDNINNAVATVAINLEAKIKSLEQKIDLLRK